MTCVYISVGNSDDRLTQQQWAALVGDVRAAVAETVAVAGVLHGYWLSAPDQPWQNACWCVELPQLPDVVMLLKERLRVIAGVHRQDSIAWAVAPDTEFLGPVPA